MGQKGAHFPGILDPTLSRDAQMEIFHVGNTGSNPVRDATDFSRVSGPPRPMAMTSPETSPICSRVPQCSTTNDSHPPDFRRPPSVQDQRRDDGVATPRPVALTKYGVASEWLSCLPVRVRVISASGRESNHRDRQRLMIARSAFSFG